MPSPRRASRALHGLLVLGTLASCDTLKARHAANEAASLYKDGNLPSAASKYEEARQLDPAIPTIHLNLGFTYLALYEAAPKGPDGARWGGRAVEEFEKYIALRPDDPRGRQYLIQTFVDSKRYDDAVAFFKPEVSATPPSLEAISLLGQIAAKVGRIDDALDWYQKRVDLAPKEAEGLEGLGVLIWDYLHNHPEITDEPRLKLADRGIASLRRATELKPGAAEAWSYWNLLLRERAAGHRCLLPDGGIGLVALDGGALTSDGGVAQMSCEQLKAADLLEADRCMRVAADLFRARAGAAQAGGGKPEDKK